MNDNNKNNLWIKMEIGLYDKKNHKRITKTPYMYLEHREMRGDESRGGISTSYAYCRDSIYNSLATILGRVPKRLVKLDLDIPDEDFVFMKSALEKIIKNHNSHIIK